MITLQQVRQQINDDEPNWRIYLMDFVDDFRRQKSLDQVAEPFILAGDRMDSLLASTAESLCDEMSIGVPFWLSEIPACRDPYFVSGLDGLKAFALLQSPLRFRIRKIFVLENFLFRV